jgi:hypothetical protein
LPMAEDEEPEDVEADRLEAPPSPESLGDT